MKKIFNFYAKYYDVFYNDKNYKYETSFILNLLKKYKITKGRLLDFGCGTGTHAIYFSKTNFDVTGVDFSEKMISIANEKIKKNNYKNIKFIKGDVKKITFKEKFKVIVSLFHVFSYQTNNEAVKKFLLNANNNLVKNGILIFDFWYGPGVLNAKQQTRIKKLIINNKILKRISKSKIDILNNTVDVNIKVKSENNLKTIYVNENHNMRYFFLPELELFLNFAGFKLIKTYRSFSSTKPTIDDWNAIVIAKKIR